MSAAGPSQEAAAGLLRESEALVEGHFQLASGKHSGAYVEKFRLLQYPQRTEALCRMIADRFRELRPHLVAGPTTGGIIVSYEVARQLGVRGIFAEKVDSHQGQGGREFHRGFELARGERTLIVDDVLTTGGSVREVMEAVRRAGGEPIGLGVLVDRSGGKVDLGLPFFACLTLDLPAFEAEECPLCAAGAPLTVT